MQHPYESCNLSEPHTRYPWQPHQAKQPQAIGTSDTYASVDWNDDAAWLGIARIVLCGLFLQRYLQQDASLFAMLEPLRFDGRGFLSLFIRAGLLDFFAKPHVVAGVQLVTIVCLTLAAVGYQTRWSLPAAATLSTVLEGCYRLWVGYFFHQYTIPLFALWGIAAGHWGGCSPFSLDAVRKTSPPIDSTVCMYVRRYVWMVVAVLYTCGGVSKLLGEGLGWVDGPALHQHSMRMSTCHSQYYNYWLVRYFPVDSPVWTLGAVSALVFELAAILVPFSKLARKVVPPALAGMHLGILALMHIDFRDTVAVCLLACGGGHGLTLATTIRWRGAGRLWCRVGGSLFVLLHVALVLLRADFWPFTPLMMFSTHEPQRVSYSYEVASWRLSDDTTLLIDWGHIWPEGAWNSQWIALARRPFIPQRVLSELCNRQQRYSAKSVERAAPMPISSLLIERWTYDVHTGDVLRKEMLSDTRIEGGPEAGPGHDRAEL